MGSSFLSINRSRQTGLFCLLALLLVVVERFVIQTPLFIHRTGLLSWAVTIDLVLGLPLLYYLAIIKPLNLSRWGILAIVSGSLAICWWILPNGARQPVIYLREGLIFAELGVGLHFVFRIRRIVSQFHQLAAHQPDFILNLHESVRLTVGQSRPVRMLTSEIIVWRYGLLGWINATEAKTDQRAFTTHQTSGQIALLVMIMVVTLIETTAVHLLLSRWFGTRCLDIDRGQCIRVAIPDLGNGCNYSTTTPARFERAKFAVWGSVVWQGIVDADSTYRTYCR